MKQILKLGQVIMLLALFSCNSTVEEITQTYPDGKPKEIQLFQERGDDRIKVGIKRFYTNGKLELMGNYDAQEKEEGKWEYYYKDGTLWTKTFYKNGQRNGIVENYFDNGNLRYKGQYTDGEKSGTWQFYTKTGELAQEKEF